MNHQGRSIQENVKCKDCEPSPETEVVTLLIHQETRPSSRRIVRSQVEHCWDVLQGASRPDLPWLPSLERQEDLG